MEKMKIIVYVCMIMNKRFISIECNGDACRIHIEYNKFNFEVKEEKLCLKSKLHLDTTCIVKITLITNIATVFYNSYRVCVCVYTTVAPFPIFISLLHHKSI